MANLRIVYKNLADSATIAGTGSLPVGNLKTDIKSQVWRSATTSGTVTATWATSRNINCVILPFTNFSSAATMRVLGLNSAEGTVFDTGSQVCCGYALRNENPGVNNFGYAGGVYASLFFTGGLVKSIAITVTDTTNPTGYVEASRLVAGTYWEPTINADYGASIGWQDASVHTRNDAGDLLTDIKPRSKTLTLNFSNASTTDREELMGIMRNGIGSPLYISVFPGDADKNLEQDYQIYGKLSQQSQIAIARYAAYSTAVTIEEI